MWVNISGTRVKVASYYGTDGHEFGKRENAVVVMGGNNIKYAIECEDIEDIGLKLDILDSACAKGNNNPLNLSFEGHIIIE